MSNYCVDDVSFLFIELCEAKCNLACCISDYISEKNVFYYGLPMKGSKCLTRIDIEVTHLLSLIAFITPPDIGKDFPVLK